MGSVFEHISINKAAEALGVQSRQIYKLIKNGRLRTFKEGKQTLVSRAGVARIIEEKRYDTVAVPLSRETVRQHEARIHMLERQVSFLMRLHDLHNEPLGFTALELQRFHEMAEACLAANWSPQQERTWKDFFIRIQLEDLEKLRTVLPDTNPWLVFHSLCRVLISKPFEEESAMELKAGKVNLERIAYVWSTTEGKTAKDITKDVEKDGKRVRKAVRRVTTARSKK